MARTFRIISTRDSAGNGIKILVHGPAGIGKTCLCATLPNPIIISSEAGLLSLKDLDIPVVEITSWDQLKEVLDWLKNSEEASDFESVCLDSISEIAEVLLAEEKKGKVDARQAYGSMQEKMSEIIREFRDLPGKNVYMSAKQERITDDNKLLYGPSMPGQKLGQQISYFFDEVFAYQIGTYKAEDGTVISYRELLTQPDGRSVAKDRSSALLSHEEPDLGKIIQKIKEHNSNG